MDRIGFGKEPEKLKERGERLRDGQLEVGPEIIPKAPQNVARVYLSGGELRWKLKKQKGGRGRSLAEERPTRGQKKRFCGSKCPERGNWHGQHQRHLGTVG